VITWFNKVYFNCLFFTFTVYTLTGQAYHKDLLCFCLVVHSLYSCEQEVLQFYFAFFFFEQFRLLFVGASQALFSRDLFCRFRVWFPILGGVLRISHP